VCWFFLLQATKLFFPVLLTHPVILPLPDFPLHLCVLYRTEMLKKVSKNTPKNFNARIRKLYGYLFHRVLHSKSCLWAKRKNTSYTYKGKILLLV